MQTTYEINGIKYTEVLTDEEVEAAEELWDDLVKELKEEETEH